VERVSLVGWSLGGPRAGGYAARHPQKVSRIVLLAPAYSADMPAEPLSAPIGSSANAAAEPSEQGRPGFDAQSSAAGAERATVSLPNAAQGGGAAMTTQSRADFDANWARQVACPDQYDPRAAASVWAEMLASDPVGATWGPGVRRAPRTAVWGWGRDVVSRTQTPMLLVAAAHDAQVTPDRVELLYQHLGAAEKVLIDLGCASHNAMWERGHRLLFDASLEWLQHGTVNGMAEGTLRLGYE